MSGPAAAFSSNDAGALAIPDLTVFASRSMSTEPISLDGLRQRYI